ncbi:MAG: MFS transporter, partial [Spirochaetota bacterium]
MRSNRYLVLIGALILQICLGSIYTWSLFNAPLSQAYGWEVAEIVLTFSIAIFCFAITTIFAGKLQKKLGFRKVATIGGFLYGSGVLLTGLALMYMPLLPLIYITYGVLAGAGVGFAYVCPLAALVKWFPKIKGTITGIGVGAFGLGSVVFKPIIKILLENPDIGAEKTFLYIGAIYWILCVLAAQLFAEPEKNSSISAPLDELKREFSVGEMVRTPAFYMMWLMFFLGCIPGLLA